MDTITVTPSSPKLVKKHSIGDIRSLGGMDRTSYGCEHTKDLLDNGPQEALKQYSKIVRTIHQTSNISTRIPKSTHSSVTLRPTFLCLQCPEVATPDQRDRHEKTHKFCVENSTGNIYCRECRDFVYDSTLEDIRCQQGKKRKFSRYMSDVDAKILAAHSTPTPCRAIGLRGLYNMGQTCFMSVVLQSLIHNPFIRAYYLAEGHRSTECERDTCTSCALDDIFTEFHSMEKAEGYGMVAMLQASWRGGGNLAGYQQQDAHEYLQFILNALHSANINPDEKEEKAEDCQCVIHKTFGGLLQSTVTCGKCKNTTTALDPFMDLSLDIRKEGPKKKKTLMDKKGADKSGEPQIPLPSMHLSECFDRFTASETLPSADYTCRKCEAQQTATKRLSLSRLPPVLPLHLKRFSHSKNASTKLDTKIKFPLTIDLSRYGSGSKSGTKLDTTATADADPDGDDEDEVKTKGDAAQQARAVAPKPVYELSAVIQHKGKMDSGHYVSFSRANDEWFMFDDSKVVLVEESDVLNSEAYMLFYVIARVEV